MLEVGDFVLDWMGRAGILIDKAPPPDRDNFVPLTDWPLIRLPESATWYLVALFSGEVVTTPAMMTESLGKPSPSVLRMAAKRSQPPYRGRLEALIPANCSG